GVRRRLVADEIPSAKALSWLQGRACALRSHAPAVTPHRYAPAKEAAGNVSRRIRVPNFYFHLTAAYAILRHCGVELGKRDFLGGIPLRVTSCGNSKGCRVGKIALAGRRCKAPLSTLRRPWERIA